MVTPFGSQRYMAHLIMSTELIFGKNLMAWLVWVVKIGLLEEILMLHDGHGRNHMIELYLPACAPSIHE